MDSLKQTASTLSNTVSSTLQTAKETMPAAAEQVKSGEEPISGELGPGTADRPFDGGNVQGEFQLSLGLFSFKKRFWGFGRWGILR